MNKLLLAGLLMLSASTAFAQSGNQVQEPINIEQKIDEVQKVLGSIEGYIFLEKGDDKARNLSNTFARTDQVELDKSDFGNLSGWKISDDNIISFSETFHTVTGKNYGESVLTLIDASGNEHNFLVLVCPTVTVASPDGALYTHQKVYNQKMKVFFSQSENFDINCVMAKYEDKVYDITDLIDPATGRYDSEKPIKSDVIYTITLTENHGDNLVSTRRMRLGVMQGKMQLMPSSQDVSLDVNTLRGMKIVATTMKNAIRDEKNPEMYEEEVFSSTGAQCIDFNENGIHDLNIGFNDGIYYIKFFDGDTLVYNYKIIINTEG